MRRGPRSGIGTADWILIWVLGLTGQLCWHVVNSWFGTFVYNEVSPDPALVGLMVAVSAAVSSFGAFLFGTLSDRRGRRKPFLVLGYILWGLFTLMFGLARRIPKTRPAAIVLFCVGCDAAMSFFGSMGNDSAFSSWTTDITTAGSRGRIGAAFAAFPVAAAIAGTLGSGLVVDRFGFEPFFLGVGLAVALSGVLASVLMREGPLERSADPRGFWRQFASVFNFRTARANRELFWVFLALAAYFTGFSVYYPYTNIYLVDYLGYSYASSGLLQAAALALAVAVSFPAAHLVDSGRNPALMGLAILASVAGLSVLCLFDGTPATAAGVFLAGLGSVLALQTLTAWMKDLFPSEARGQFEGMRIVFYSLVPMSVAPLVSGFVIRRFGVPMSIGGEAGMVPDESLLFAAGLLILLAFVPLFPAARLLRARTSAGRSST